MAVPMERPPEAVRGQQLPLPLEPQAAAPTLPPHQIWAGLPPLTQARVREAFILVVREVLHAADRR
jgi:hypothetical protein